MCKIVNHKLLTFVFGIQPLLWLQGIDRLKWFNNHFGVGELVVWEMSGGIPFDGSMLLLERSSGNVGVQLLLGVRKNKPQKTRCRSLVNFDGRWVGRAVGDAGSASSYWLRDLTCLYTPRVGDVDQYMYACLNILGDPRCEVECRKALILSFEKCSSSHCCTGKTGSQWTSFDKGSP